jgi:hypothetical protein
VTERRDDSLVRIRPRPDVRVVSQGRTVLITDPDGFFDGGAERGLFVHQTRMLSRYRWLIEGERPQPVALSSVAQHSWLGYYACLPPGRTPGPPDQGSRHLEEASGHTLELRLSRHVGGGLHEDVSLTNFSQHPTSFVLELELAADFADQEETRGERRQRGRLQQSWKDAFWMEDAGFFAMGLDAQGRLIRSVGSNPGHCVAAGIVDTERAERTVQRLMAPDLFSGWGVRTLSSSHPAYNPYSYHRGSVWPVEHGSFALGFMRYGLHGPLEALCRGMFEAARVFDLYRLPEVFSGHRRDADHPFPALYPQTNSPQAWSASAIFALLQSMLGLYPFAPLGVLLVDPQLPSWLPEITLRNLRVGSAVVTLRFSREGTGSTYEVLEKRGRLYVVRQPSPWSLTAGFAERLRDALSSLLPGG